MIQIIFEDAMEVLLIFFPLFGVLAGICLADYMTNFIINMLKKGRDSIA